MPSSSELQNALALDNRKAASAIPGGSVGERIVVKTKAGPPTPNEVSLDGIGNDDLKRIKSQDPFLYYSIPAARMAEFFGKELDLSRLGNTPSGPSNADVMPARGGAKSWTVKRSTAISVECHPDLIFESMLEEDEDLEGVIEDTTLLDFLAKYGSKHQ